MRLTKEELEALDEILSEESSGEEGADMDPSKVIVMEMCVTKSANDDLSHLEEWALGEELDRIKYLTNELAEEISKDLEELYDDDDIETFRVLNKLIPKLHKKVCPQCGKKAIVAKTQILKHWGSGAEY